jgi:hypothetical protein
VFAAYLAWHLGTLARTAPQAIGALGWALFAYQLVGVYVSFIELSGLLRILSVALAICTGWAAWLTRGAGSASTFLRLPQRARRWQFYRGQLRSSKNPFLKAYVAFCVLGGIVKSFPVESPANRT